MSVGTAAGPTFVKKPSRDDRNFTRALPNLLVGSVMWSLVVIMAMPLVWAILTSLKPDTETQHYPPTIIPHEWTIHNYFQLFKVIPFGTYYLNTVEVAAAAAVLTILISSMAAYSMARFRFFVSELASFVGLAAYMLPGILIVVPVFRIFNAIHALDSLPSIILLYTAYFVPFGVWQLRSYFAGIPIEVEDAAMVDGATRFEAFFLVVLPQALPGLIATGIFTFAVVWNEYLFASLLLYSPKNQTLSAGMATILIGQFNLYSWGVLMAGCTLMSLPILIIFMIVQKQLVAGVSSGSVKG
jgi:multiple sugar transport system permease protein